MAHYGSGDGFSWDSQRPNLTHQASDFSIVSALSDPMTPPTSTDSHHRPTAANMSDEYALYGNEGVDISHVRLSASEYFESREPSTRSSRSIVPSNLIPGSLRAGSPSTTYSGNNLFSRNLNTAYAPVLDSEAPSAHRNTSIKSGRARFSFRKSQLGGHYGHSTVTENDIDMGLLASSMPMAYSNESTAYRATAEYDDEELLSPVGNGAFDISSFESFTAKPISTAQLHDYNRQEASGILTGGLGGAIPNTIMTSRDLYASSPQTPTSPTVTRGLSFRRSSIVNQAPSLKALGQREANRRGEVIEVILENEQDRGQEAVPVVDISTFSGGDTPAGGFDNIDYLQARKTFKQEKTMEVFYPQANWKPFSMRWPYLIATIVLSFSLAGIQEYMYQVSRKRPLYTFNTPLDLSTWDYFSFKYLPTMVAVSFGVLWQITDFEVKRLEPYYQLSRPGGAMAAESINVDYITFFSFFRPFKALKFRHYAVAISSMATIFAVSLIPPIQSASIILSPSRAERIKDPLGVKEIHIDPAMSRFLSAVLVFIALLGCVLVWQLHRRPSGLIADVKGIAGVAAMANRSHILMDFKNMDTATPETIHRTLKAHRYSLKNSSLAPEEKSTLTQEEKDKYDQQHRHVNPHPFMLRIGAGAPFVLFMIFFMALIPTFLFTSANIVTERAPWLLTALAVCIKLIWGTLETDIRMIEPFYILSRRHASPKVLTLDYTAMPFGWMPVCAFLNRHFLVALVGLGSVFAEILTVCATSFSTVAGSDFTKGPSENAGINAGEETFDSFWASFSLAMFILTYLCIVAIVTYARRRHAFLPRQPSTIASILAFIHQSKMLYDFVGTEKMSNSEMVKKLSGIGKTYGLGWFTGRDGEMHCGVDEEELVSNYKHGDDVRKASMPWTTNWSDY